MQSRLWAVSLAILLAATATGCSDPEDPGLPEPMTETIPE